jgi:uncharacterized lipoprotein YddW (UPF0748 family)
MTKITTNSWLRKLCKVSLIPVTIVALNPVFANAQQGQTQGTSPDTSFVDPHPYLSQAEFVEEVRGVWITNVASNVLYNKDEIARAMDYLAANGINVVFPVVWNKSETQYRSQIMEERFGIEIERTFETQGRDPLAELIVEAHRNGMEVIPWFEYGFAASFGDATGGRLVQANPHWASRDIEGNIAERNGFYWLNGLHPEVQDFMNSLIHEVIDNYDVDGIQGDDRLPAMASNGGYDDYTRDLYASEHNGAQPPIFPTTNSWLIWRADKLTNYLGRLYRSVKEKDENLIVSMSPSHYRFSFENYLQDPPRWLDSMYVDMIHPQLYRYTTGAYLETVQAVVGPRPGSTGGYVKPEYRDKLSPGIIVRAGNQFVTPAQVRQKIAYNREYGINGEVFFFYEGMGAANNYLADTLRTYFYDKPAILPFRQGQRRRPPGTIVNETDFGALRSNGWQAVIPTQTPRGYRGVSLRANAGSEASITYRMEVEHEAWYNVYAYVPYDQANASIATESAVYTVYYNNGADSLTTTIDQSEFRNRGWMHIGNVYLEQGPKDVVKIKASDASGGVVFADATMLLIDRKKSPDVQIPVSTSIENTENELPTGITLHPAYPNPFNPTTTLRYELNTPQPVKFAVYDLLGREVSVLVDQLMPAGIHESRFDASGLSSGIYVTRLQAGNQVLTGKLTLIK